MYRKAVINPVKPSLLIILLSFTYYGFDSGVNGYKLTYEAAGSITGVVKFDKSFPKSKRVRVSKDNEVCGNIKKVETFLVHRDSRGLKNVLLTIEGVSSKKNPSPVSAITVEQTGCDYSPHFQVAEIGSEGVKLTILNNDGILHNIHTYNGKETLFNIAQPKFKKRLSKTIKEPGIIKLKCDVHAWMEAYVVLLKDQPYYAVTDENGNFSIDGIPPGAYTVKAWHEALGSMEKRVDIIEGAQSELDFIIKPKGK